MKPYEKNLVQVLKIYKVDSPERVVRSILDSMDELLWDKITTGVKSSLDKIELNYLKNVADQYSKFSTKDKEKIELIVERALDRLEYKVVKEIAEEFYSEAHKPIETTLNDLIYGIIDEAFTYSNPKEIKEFLLSTY